MQGSEQSRRARAHGILSIVFALPLLIAPFLIVDEQAATLFGLEGPACLLGRHAEGACPGCGLTRSIALAAHGEIGRSFRVHPAGGLVLFLASTGSLVHAWIAWRGGRPTRVQGRLLMFGRHLFLMGIAAAWLAKCFLVAPA